jgi:hypothetical protein
MARQATLTKEGLMKKRALIVLAVMTIPGAAWAQTTTYVRPDPLLGAPSGSNPYGGGYVATTPGRGTSYIRPDAGGGYVITTPQQQSRPSSSRGLFDGF